MITEKNNKILYKVGRKVGEAMVEDMHNALMESMIFPDPPVPYQRIFMTQKVKTESVININPKKLSFLKRFSYKVLIKLNSLFTRAINNMFYYSCPFCGYEFETEYDSRHNFIECPECGQWFTNKIKDIL